MRMVLPMSRIREMEPYMDAKVLNYIHEGQIEAFEGFESFDLIAFDWYDVRSRRTAASQMLVYLDREDLFIFCEDDAAESAARAVLQVPEEAQWVRLYLDLGGEPAAILLEREEAAP